MEFNSIYEKIITVRHEFPNQYAKWSNKHSYTLDIIKPSKVNERYKLLLQRNSEEGKAKGKKPQSGTKLVEDFNKYVDELLKLTPHNKAYPV